LRTKQRAQTLLTLCAVYVLQAVPLFALRASGSWLDRQGSSECRNPAMLVCERCHDTSAELTWPPRRCSHFYAVLVPLTLPVTLAAVFLNWLSIKFYKHA
jgi:hypothetical protein